MPNHMHSRLQSRLALLAAGAWAQGPVRLWGHRMPDVLESRTFVFVYVCRIQVTTSTCENVMKKR